MQPLLKIFLFFALAIAPCVASPFFQQGTLLVDSQVALFNITANTAETITIETYSYGGGTVNLTTINPGGFAPIGYLFDNVGDVLTVTNANCVNGANGQSMDPTTSSCNDLNYTNTLGPGTFTLGLAVYDNTPVDGNLADGFTQEDNPGFTCSVANGGNGTGAFCDDTQALPSQNSRTGNFGVTIAGADSVSYLGLTPEPGSLFLLLVGGAALALLRRRAISRA